MLACIAARWRLPYKDACVESQPSGEFPVATLTEIVAAVVVHSSAAAYSHFGMSLEPAQKAHPPVERTISRAAVKRSEKSVNEECPDQQRAKVVKV